MWTADLDDPAYASIDWSDLLSADEQARFEQLRAQSTRARFVTARGLLRSILGAYLHQSPDLLEFAYGMSGKPQVLSSPTLYFNLAHAQGCAVIAVTCAGDVGVDVEEVKPLDRLDQMARRFFAPAEADEIQSAANAERPALFFRCWVRKEAFIKALGDGLSRPLNSFAVTLAPSSPVVTWVGDQPGDHGWCLHHLEPRPGFVGALAHRVPQADVHCLTLEPQHIVPLLRTR